MYPLPTLVAASAAILFQFSDLELSYESAFVRKVI